MKRTLLTSIGVIAVAAIALVGRGGRRTRTGDGRARVSTAATRRFNAESDPLSLAAASHRLEFDALRREIELRIDQHERVTVILYAFIGAIVASQLALERYPDVERVLLDAPYSYLLVALALLWFPVDAVLTYSYLDRAAHYIRDVLSPKLTKLSESEQLGSPYVTTYVDWQRRALPAELHGQLRWEAYLDRTETTGPRAFAAAMGLVSILRTAMLYAPACLVVGRYLAVRPSAGDVAPAAIVAEGLAATAITTVVAATTIVVRRSRDFGWLRRNPRAAWRPPTI